MVLHDFMWRDTVATSSNGNLDAAFGNARIAGVDRRTTSAVMQGTTLFRKCVPNGWAQGW